MQISLKKHVKLKKFTYFQVKIIRIFHFLPFSNTSFPNPVEFFHKTPYFETFRFYPMRILFFYANFEYFFQKKFAYSFSSNCEEYSGKKIYSKICKFRGVMIKTEFFKFKICIQVNMQIFNKIMQNFLHIRKVRYLKRQTSGIT